MPRHAGLDAPGTLHHVMIRRTEGQPIFRGDKDRQDFLSCIAQIWAPMSNVPDLTLLSAIDLVQ